MQESSRTLRRVQDLNLCRDCSLEFSKLVQLAAMRTLQVFETCLPAGRPTRYRPAHPPWCTRTELNCHQGLRKPLLYPLSYGCRYLILAAVAQPTSDLPRHTWPSCAYPLSYGCNLYCRCSLNRQLICSRAICLQTRL
jgi:hypothetical protein